MKTPSMDVRRYIVSESLIEGEETERGTWVGTVKARGKIIYCSPEYESFLDAMHDADRWEKDLYQSSILACAYPGLHILLRHPDGTLLYFRRYQEGGWPRLTTPEEAKEICKKLGLYTEDLVTFDALPNQ